MIAGPVLSPCSFHSSWSCAALRQGHPASRDQLTDQEQCEAAKRITTRAKILSIDGPKTKRQKCSGFQGRQSGPPQFKNMCGHKRSQGVENNCSRRCKTMGNPVAQRYAKLLSRTCGNNRNLHYFSTGGKNFADKRHPFWGPFLDPKTGAKSSGHKQIKLRLNEWPPFWCPFLDPKTGAVLSAKFESPAKNSKSFDCFCAYATEVFHAAAFPWFCSAAGTCSPHPANIYGHTCS